SAVRRLTSRVRSSTAGKYINHGLGHAKQSLTDGFTFGSSEGGKTKDLVRRIPIHDGGLHVDDVKHPDNLNNIDREWNRPDETSVVVYVELNQVRHLASPIGHGGGHEQRARPKTLRAQVPDNRSTWAPPTRAGDENRTRALSLGSSCSTIKL